MSKKDKTFCNREIGWLHFNGRVLQEAMDKRNPLLERLKFLGIFSNNLDEFYRVRVATITKLRGLKVEPPPEFFGQSPKKLLKKIALMTAYYEKLFGDTYKELHIMLEKEGIRIVDETNLTKEQEDFVRNYFKEIVRMYLFPVMVRKNHTLDKLRDQSIYLAVGLKKSDSSERDVAVIEVPADVLGRFVILPSRPLETDVILLDDVIRFCLDEIFAVFGYNHFEAYTFKFTRDAELDLDNDISKSFLQIISEGVKHRISGNPVRFIYDREMPKDILNRLIQFVGIRKQDVLISGERYHNFKDFMSFPSVGSEDLRYPPIKTVSVPELQPGKSVFTSISSGDILIHYPYQPFQHLVDLLREASLDPKVSSIKMTLYRLARNSSVVNALINAARNGKKVTVFIELQARFDEEANIRWARILQEAGVKILPSLPNLKVHSKLCLIKRRESGTLRLYAAISTGNFNETTARIYCDETLLTADPRITQEVEQVFDLFSNPYKGKHFKHLMVAPNHLRSRLNRMIDDEIKAAKNGEKALIIFKLNSLTDFDMAKKLRVAARSGVMIKLIIRGSCIIMPKLEDPFFVAISIVDRFLEHSRIYYFYAGGKERIFISSADLMPRNLDRRVEVAAPIYDERLKKRLKDILEIQLSDNVKSRLLSKGHINEYRKTESRKNVRSQYVILDYLRKTLGENK